ncbi:methyltransferase domain-containing protein [Micromonospora sp. HM5-17]|uniref:methyltransferase domain-containing protein n=1 Tax=Micromonospora sp. HM5-17 TaxID=2487710 RepID=UPI000F4A55E3|nr:methyltransferase domain-containing protein [Micromonospora sp. HM5-17]ROT31242.1 methyltransferase domain-containing protein [Micromonospora sp. HM5-17]
MERTENRSEGVPTGRASSTAGPQATPRTAVVWAVLRRELDRQADRRLSVLDVGGGTGGFAVPLAEAGHRVTVVDASPDALAALTRRAAEAGVAERVSAVQGDGDALADLVEPASVDLVLCHAVLEVVDDPAGVVAAVAAALRPGGAASLLVASRAAAVLSRVTNGHLDVAAALLADPDGRAGPRDTLRRRYDADSAAALLRAAGLEVEQIHGVRVFADLVPAVAAETDPQALLELELAAAARPPYRDVAAQLHLFARRPE